MDLFTRLATQLLAQQGGHRPALRAALPATYAARSGPAESGVGLEAEDFPIRPPTALPASTRAAADARQAAGSDAAAAVAGLPAQAREPQAPHPLRDAVTSQGRAAAAQPTMARPSAAPRERPALQPLPTYRSSERRDGAAPSASLPRSPITVDLASAVSHPPAAYPAPSATERLQQGRTAPLARATPPLSPQRAKLLAPYPAQVQPAAAPVVHLHIDRIEVRAPATPPKTVPARVPRPAPAVSLSDYLRKGGPR